MRRVRHAVVASVFLGLACGKTDETGAPAEQGGRPAGATGGSEPSGGGAGAAGGAWERGGTQSGGSPGGLGGSGRGEFLGCGCGCCDGALPQRTRCYYPEVSGDLESLIAADAAAHEDPGCANVGCSGGVRYLACEAPAADTSPVSYTASYVLGAYDRSVILKQGAGRSARASFLTRLNASDIRTALDLPRDWFFEGGSYTIFSTSAAHDAVAVGASGSIKYRASSSGCLLDMHFSVFMLDGAELVPVRFDADGVPISGAAPCADM